MLIALDLETTGLEAADRLCAVGAIACTDAACETHEALLKPPRRIPPEAMAVHHITNEAVADAPMFAKSETQAWLDARNERANTLVAHNAAFDLSMLENEGFVWQGDVIDTLRCARHLLGECAQHGLQFLRYELKLYKREAKAAAALGIELRAHRALSDALHVKLLLEALLEMRDLDELKTLTNTPVLIAKFSFGKYNGRYIEEVAMNDPGYLRWMLNALSDLDEDMKHTLRHWLG